MSRNGLVPAGDPQLYWTIDLRDGQLSLREGTKEHTLDLVLRRDGKETVLRTLAQDTDYARPEGVSAWPFTDVLSRDGFVLRTEWLNGAWARNEYESVVGDTAVPLAESFGFGEPQDYSVDLENTGERELVANVTYAGGGSQRAYVYQRRPSGIWRGSVSPVGIPDFEDRGAGSFRTVYDPARNVFLTDYAVKGNPGFTRMETRGLDRMVFHLYKGGA